jgi:hypothetical protein
MARRTRLSRCSKLVRFEIGVHDLPPVSLVEDRRA